MWWGQLGLEKCTVLDGGITTMIKRIPAPKTRQSKESTSQTIPNHWHPLLIKHGNGNLYIGYKRRNAGKHVRIPEGIDDFSGQHIPIHHIHSISKLRCFQKYLQFWWFMI